MKKRSKKIFEIGIVLCFIFTLFQLPKIHAAGGGATLTLSPDKKDTELGSNVVVTLSISNINVDDPEGIASIGGVLSYDENYLELNTSSIVSINPTINFSFVPATKKFAWVYGGTGIKANTNLVRFTFKTKQLGTTKVSVTSPLLSDSVPNRLTSTINDATVNIVTPRSTNANLSSLSIEGYNFTPAFSSSKQNGYTLTVPNDVATIKVNATAEDANATVSGTGNVNLNVGVNNVNVVVTAQNGGKKTYTIAVTRQALEPVKSNDNNLNDLSVNGYTINPQFDKDQLNYTLSIPYEATEIIVNTLKSNENATVEVSGNTNLQVGENTVSITVTAENGDKKVYTIAVNREDKVEQPTLDSDATLKSLYIGGFTLNPTFASNINVYSIKVGEAVTGLNVDAIPNSEKATVEIAGNLGWEYGVNQVLITVTAEDGTKNVYIINATRTNPISNNEPVKSGDNYLSNLTIKGTELIPNFDKNISNYSVKIPYEVEKLDLNYITNSDKAKVEVIGNGDFKVGSVNTVEIKVTAEDGSVRIYTINVTKSAVTSKNDLKSLIVDKYSLSPNFDKKIDEYNVKVKHNTESLDLTAIAENENATVEIIGNHDFKEGNNVVLIKVTDENGFTHIYQINVEKPALTILGMSLGQFLMFLLLGLGMLGLLILIIILMKRKNNNKETPITPVTPTPNGPVIEFKPEINFGSKNGTDDDIVYPNATLYQGSNVNEKPDPKFLGDAKHASKAELPLKDDVPYDPYDEVVTKEEIIDAIKEGIETKNPEKLKMLLKQEELNKLKDELKERENHSNHDDWGF